MTLLGALSNIAAILTATVAVWAFGRYVWERRQKRLFLEQYLREEKTAGGGQGKRTLLHLVAHLGMSESELLDAAFRSRCVRRRLGVDAQGRADRLLLEYDSSNPEDDLPG
ncbi:MAG TPA: hypothetical protein ENH55_06440 [Aurantimonas coralicida]|uniref:Uncharacterized protein n=2 Tax=root TaxID=1 RepID=A0A9C9NEH5_9HYPH|nr:hypothetical protein [Aurantimonas coralicida]HEU00307.1 hypothetical protein [Aurantimonas coralicida]